MKSMINRMWDILLLLLASFFCLNGFSYDGPLGDKWDKFSIAKTQNNLELTQATYIRANVFELNHQIITNGYPLTIEAKELIVGTNGKIIGFTKHPPLVTEVPEQASKGADGESSDDDFRVRRGKQGATGRTGYKGENGHQNPGLIKILAMKVSGSKLLVNANGQNGGKGGTGGQGGNGGNGANGRNGKVDINPNPCNVKTTTAVPGGDAGKGGVGGTGGQGGDAGIAIPVEIYLPISSYTLIQNHGRPGEGGDPGEYGIVGDVGKGGKGDHDSHHGGVCKARVKSKPDGSAYQITMYPIDDSQKKHNTYYALEEEEERLKRFGIKGIVPSSTYNSINFDTNNLYIFNKDVRSTAKTFQLQRYYHLLVQDSFRLVSTFNVNRLMLDGLDSSLRDIILQADLKSVDVIIESWNEYFIEEEKSSEKYIIKTAQKMVSILKMVKNDPSTMDAYPMAKDLIEISKNMVTENFDLLVDSCERYLRTLNTNDNLILFRPFAIPVCTKMNLVSLEKNPFEKIDLGLEMEKLLEPNAINGIKIIENEINQEREIASFFKMIVYDNISFNHKDINRINSTFSGTLLELELPGEDEITIENFAIHLQILNEAFKNE